MHPFGAPKKEFYIRRNTYFKDWDLRMFSQKAQQHPPCLRLPLRHHFFYFDNNHVSIQLGTDKIYLNTKTSVIKAPYTALRTMQHHLDGHWRSNYRHVGKKCLSCALNARKRISRWHRPFRFPCQQLESWIVWNFTQLNIIERWTPCNAISTENNHPQKQPL